MDLDLMSLSATVCLVIAFIGFFQQQNREQDAKWGKVVYVSIGLLSIVQLLMFNGVLNISKEPAGFVIIVILTALVLMAWLALKERNFAPILVYSVALQLLVHLDWLHWIAPQSYR
ncbi:MAG: hypothetical protein R3F30_10130 [Planctomycetota bacterium]